MKKYILLFSFATAGVLSAQIRVNGNVTDGGADGSTAFLDASSSRINNNTTNLGKGLVFPKVDLSTLTQLKASGRTGVPTNYPSNMDGMLVYNIANNKAPAIGESQTPKVTPGFYYYKNDSNNLQGGHWVRIGGGADAVAAGVNNGEFWTLKGNLNTNPVTETDVEVAQKTYEFKSTAAGKDFFGTTDDKNVMFATAKEDNGNFKMVARLEIGEKTNQEVGAKNDFKFVLDVYGKARFRDGIVTSASTYPDYVFDNYFTGKSDVNPNYEFKKLDEVETFIKENNHLPGVTKIDDLAKTELGYEVDNTQLSIQTLEKVEELYLHVIEQQKEIQALKAEIAELKK